MIDFNIDSHEPLEVQLGETPTDGFTNPMDDGLDGITSGMTDGATQPEALETIGGTMDTPTDELPLPVIHDSAETAQVTVADNYPEVSPVQMQKASGQVSFMGTYDCGPIYTTEPINTVMGDVQLSTNDASFAFLNPHPTAQQAATAAIKAGFQPLFDQARTTTDLRCSEIAESMAAIDVVRTQNFIDNLKK